MAPQHMIVVSGAPGAGKTTVAAVIADGLGFPLLSLDVIKEILGDQLGTGDEDWSDLLGDTAAEIIFRLAPTFPSVVVEGWWRGTRRDRAVKEFAGWVEVFCSCEAALAEERMRARHAAGRHPIHRDVINPKMMDRARGFAETVVPLRLGAALVTVDTTEGFDGEPLLSNVQAALKGAS